ncbi:hypothetical protein PMIN06_004558 [Paraphaeosphaeria minitans]
MSLAFAGKSSDLPSDLRATGGVQNGLLHGSRQFRAHNTHFNVRPRGSSSFFAWRSANFQDASSFMVVSVVQAIRLRRQPSQSVRRTLLSQKKECLPEEPINRAQS